MNETGEEARGRSAAECGCPEWVVMCVHFGGRGLMLVTNAPEGVCDHNFATTGAIRRRDIIPENYVVVNMSELLTCGLCNAPAVGTLRLGPKFYVGNDKDAAVAAFRAEEERIIRDAF